MDKLQWNNSILITNYWNEKHSGLILGVTPSKLDTDFNNLIHKLIDIWGVNASYWNNNQRGLLGSTQIQNDIFLKKRRQHWTSGCKQINKDDVPILRDILNRYGILCALPPSTYAILWKTRIIYYTTYNKVTST